MDILGRREFSRKLGDDVDRRLLTDSEFSSWLIFLREFFPNIICLVPSIGEVKQFYIAISKKVSNFSGSSSVMETFQSDIPRLLCFADKPKSDYVVDKSDLASALAPLRKGVTSKSVYSFLSLFSSLPYEESKFELIFDKIGILNDLLSKFEGKEETFVVIDWSSVEGMILLSNFAELFKFRKLAVVMDEFENAFKVEFKNPKIMVCFKKHIDACFAAWDPTMYYTAYTTVVNASMTGKSRMVCQLPELGAFLFLVCLRKEDEHPSIPPRTPKIADAFDKLDTMTECEAQSFVFQYMIACILGLNEWLENLQIDRTKLPTTQRELAKMWFNYQKTGLPQETGENISFMDHAASFWSKILEKIQPTPWPIGDPRKRPMNTLKKDASSELEKNLRELVRILKN
jgi:hypothetical protein